MVYGLMLDEFEEDERRREADDAAITIALLQDVGTVPAEFGESDTGPPAAPAARTANHKIRPVVNANNNFVVPPVVGLPVVGAASGSRRGRVSRAPPMVGREDPVVDDGSNHPSMDDPSIIYSGDNPVQVAPPAAPPPANSTPSSAPSQQPPLSQPGPNAPGIGQPVSSGQPHPA